MPKKYPQTTVETIRRLHLDQGLSGVAIAKQLNLPVSTVNYILKKLGRKVMKPVKQATEAQIKDEQAIQEIQGAVRESIEQRKQLMDAMKDIALREPITVKVPVKETNEAGREVTRMVEKKIDDPNKVRAAQVWTDMRNSYDELLGIVDVAVRKKLEEHDEKIKRMERNSGKA